MDSRFIFAKGTDKRCRNKQVNISKAQLSRKGAEIPLTFSNLIQSFNNKVVLLDIHNHVPEFQKCKGGVQLFFS